MYKIFKKKEETDRTIKKKRGKATALLLVMVILTSSFSLILINDSEQVQGDIDERFTVDGIRYNITGTNTVEVVGDAYEGDIQIPVSVQFSGTTYNVTGIGNAAFFLRNEVDSVEIPSTVEYIDTFAFFGCYNLTSIDLKFVSSIGNLALDECFGLTSISVDDNNTTYSSTDGVLFNKYETELILYPAAKSETSYTIPGSVLSISERAFQRCSNLTEIKVNVNNTEYYSDDGVLFNKNGIELIQYPIGRTGDSYTVPSTITTIGNYAFFGCTSLDTIDLSSVTTIGDYTFERCDNLDTVTSNSLTSIGDSAFYKCTSLTLIDLSSVTTIGEYAFWGCTILTGIDLNLVTTIGTRAFYECIALTTIMLPSSLTYINGNVFEGCINLESIEVNANNTHYISENGVLFDIDKTRLMKYPAKKTDTFYVIPYSVTSIDPNAFENCINLTSIDLSSVKEIGFFAFYDCSGLISATLSSAEHIEMGAFSGCSGLVSITIPPSVKRIEDMVFADCSSLTSIEIPSSVTYIGVWAFGGCTGLTSVTIPSSVRSIEWNAFDDCTNLSVAVLYHLTETEDEAFPEHTVQLRTYNADVVVSAVMNSDGGIEMTIVPGEGKIVSDVRVVWGTNESIDVIKTGGKWTFIPVSDVTEFKVYISTSDDGWNAVNIIFVGSIAVAVIALISMLILRKP